MNDTERAVLEMYLTAQDALDNREYCGINAEPHETLVRRRNIARCELEVVVGAAQADGDSPLSDFQEGQWWVSELDSIAMYADGQSMVVTHDLKRAVAVVHHMLRAAQKGQPVKLPEPDGEIYTSQLDYATVHWLRQTSETGGGDPRNSYSWPITQDRVYLASTVQALLAAQKGPQ